MIEVKHEAEKKKTGPKYIFKPQEKPAARTQPPKKYEAENSGFQGMVNDAKMHTQQIKKIMIVVKGEDQKETAAEEKLKKIMSILGLNLPSSNIKDQNQPQSREKTNSSLKCEPSKSSSKKSRNGESNSEKNENVPEKSQLKSHLSIIDEKSENAEGTKKPSKKFDCEEIQRNLSRRYYLHPPSNQKSARQSRMSSRSFSKFDDDPKYNQNLLSPEVDTKERKRPQGSLQKSVMGKSHRVSNLSIEKSQNKSLKKIEIEPSHKKIQQKESSVKNTEEAPKVASALKELPKVTSAAKSAQKIVRSSQKKENQEVFAEKIIL